MTLNDIDLTGRLLMCEIDAFSRTPLNTQSANELANAILLSDDHSASNATWLATHLSDKNMTFLQPYKEQFTDQSMTTPNQSKQRLLLNILLRMPITKDELRSDFWDFCLNSITDMKLPVGTRCLCLKMAYAQSLHYDELQSELREVLSLMEPPLLEPAMKAAHKKIVALLRKDQ